jgi:hypothetical protein
MSNPDADKSIFKNKADTTQSRQRGIKPAIYTSNYLGVGFYKSGTGGLRVPKRHWRATYNLNGRKHHIGFYETELEAALARDEFIVENALDLPLNFS